VARTTIPKAASVLVIDTVLASSPGQSLDFGSFGFNGAIVPGTFPGDPAGKHLIVDGLMAGETVALDYGVAVPQGRGVASVLNPALHSIAVANDGGTATTVMKSPKVSSTTWSGRYLVSVYATDASNNFLGVTAYPPDGADLHLTVPQPFTYSPAVVATQAPYPRIQQAFTSAADGTVHVIAFGLADKTWTAFATTAWLGGAGKAVTWEFPDFTAVAGWDDAMWPAWAMGDFTVSLDTAQCGSLQRTLDQALLGPGTPQPGDSCTTIQTNGSDVTLP
jgi:hypothetical protein